MPNSRSSWKRVLLAAAAAGVVAIPLVGGPAQASTGDATLQVIASGLNNPRGITALSDGTILVAEAGAGDPACPADSRCAGLTGSIFKVKGSSQSRVVTGLASVAATAANAPVVASGPNHVLPDPSGGYDVLNAFGETGGVTGSDTTRTELGPNGATLGTVLRTRDGKVLADLTDHETRLNPDGADINANPFNFVSSGSGFLVTDAGGNTVVRTGSGGSTSTAYVLPTNNLPAGSQQAVPTGIVKTSDGTLYVSDLSGTVAGASRIWQIKPGQQPQVVVTGLSDVIDLALDHSGNLLALSYTQGFGATGPLPGALSKIDLKTFQATSIPTGTQLTAPTGLAVGPAGQIYVTNNATGTSGQLDRVIY
jgi:hypothetical protein